MKGHPWESNQRERLGQPPSVLSAATNGSGSHTIFSRSYDFHLATADNGLVYQIVNGLDGNRTQNFLYDNLNRITQANTSGPSWGETFTVDPWGNLTNRGLVSGKNTYEPLNAAVDNNNRVAGLGYDGAGNLTSDGTNTYVYDDENRITSTGGYTYSYDANGQRIRKMGGLNRATTAWGQCANRCTLKQFSVADLLICGIAFDRRGRPFSLRPARFLW